MIANTIIEKFLVTERKKEGEEANKKFMNDTKSTEILIIILKAHLYIERELTNMLTETIIDYKIISTATFRQKLDIANSMGLIDEYYGAIGKVNSIRNGYAHNIDYSFGEKEYQDLISTLPKTYKDDIINSYKKAKEVLYDSTIPEFNFKTQFLLNNIWYCMVLSHITAKKSIELRLNEKEAEAIQKFIEKGENND